MTKVLESGTQMKVLVTGAAGFIGSYLLNYLNEKNFEVLGLDNFSDYYSIEYKMSRLKALKIEHLVHKLDLNNSEELDKIMATFMPDYIIHLAAQAGVRIPFSKSETYISNNINSFINICLSAIKFNIKGILYASSSSVYGDSTPVPFSEKSLTLNPNSIYGITKLTNELMASVISSSNKIKMRGMRFFTVYGPWGRPDMAYMKMSASAMESQIFRLFGDGEIKRDLTYIDDVIKCVTKLLDELSLRKEKFNDIVNIGGGNPVSMKLLIEKVEYVMNRKIEISYKPGNTSDSKITMADKTYLESLIGKTDFTSISLGMEKIYEWITNENIKNKLGQWNFLEIKE